MARHVPSERLFLSEGSEVEVSYKDNAIEGVWYKAIIETKPLSEELSVRLLKDDFSTPLDELEDDDNDNVLIRPIPPKKGLDHIKIKIGTIVEADYKDAWWTGLVVKKIEDNKYLVFFHSLSDIIQFDRKHLRPHLQWGDEKMYSWAFVPTQHSEFLRRLATEPMFCPGKMVEVSSRINEAEVVWVSAMFIKKLKDDDDDDDKYIVKVCDNPLICKSNEAIPNKTVDLRSLRPTPPSIKEYQLGEYVEVFHDGMGWRQGRVMGSEGRVMGTLSQNWYVVLLEATKKQLIFKQSDLRPLKVWEDGVWKTLTKGSEDKTGDSVMNANESDPPVTPPPGITTTLFKQIEAETQRKTLLRNQNCSGNKLTRENEKSEDTTRKRKREENLCSDASVKDSKAKDTTMTFPFEKKLRIWKTLETTETMESPLTQGSGDKMSDSVINAKESDPPVTPSPGITETPLEQTEAETQTKTLPKKTLPKNQNGSGKDSTRENENSEDITRKRKREENLCSDASVKDSKAKDTIRDLPFEKIEELKGVEKVTAEKESVKVENERQILELQRLKEEADKEIAQSKSYAAKIVKQLEDVKLEFQATASAPW